MGRTREGERGSAVAEFTMLVGLLVFLVMAVVQLALALYIRNTVLQCAVEGARYGARADVAPAQGAQRARELISDFTSSSYAEHVSSAVVSDGGVQVVEVTVSTPLPIIGVWGPDGLVTVSGRAYKEGQS